MGVCSSSAELSFNGRRKRGRTPALSSSVGGDFDEMLLDELIRIGIAEAQLATVTRKRKERAKHVRAARSVLAAAARRCDGAEESHMRAHLVAVLVKLGEKPESLPQWFAEAARGEEADHNEDTAADDAEALRAAAGSAIATIAAPLESPPPLALSPIGEDRTLDSLDNLALAATVALRTRGADSSPKSAASDHSSEAGDGELWDYADMDADAQNFLGSSDSEKEEDNQASFVSDLGSGRRAKRAQVGAIDTVSRNGLVRSCIPDSIECEWQQAGTNEEPPLLDDGSPRSTLPQVSPVPSCLQSSPQHSWSTAARSAAELEQGAAEGIWEHGSASRTLTSPCPSIASSESGRSGASRARTIQPQQGSPSLTVKRRRTKKDSPSVEELCQVDADVRDPPQVHSFAPAQRHNGRQPSQSGRPVVSPALSSKEAASQSVVPRNADSAATQRCDDACSSGRFEDLSANARAFVELASPKSGKPPSRFASRIQNPLANPELLFGEAPVQLHSNPFQTSPSLQSLACRSTASSPFDECAFPLNEMTPHVTLAQMPIGSRSTISVRVRNGVSGEEETRFAMSMDDCFSEQHFLTVLERRSQQHVGQTLADLNWLHTQEGGRLERRQCDLHMVEEIFKDGALQGNCPVVLLLCTVPATPPSELVAGRVRLRGLVPDRLAPAASAAVQRIRLETSALDAGSNYSVALTHQWSNVTYVAQAKLLHSRRGVEFYLPPQLLAASQSSAEGLYDVHLVVDGKTRSQNRRGFTLGSSESELSSSTSTSSFMPIRRMASRLSK